MPGRTGHERLVIRTALAVTLAAAAALPAEAGASRIVYGCGYELCSISPDGSGRNRLTHDGHRSPRHLYREPSVSRSGRRLAFVRGQHPTTSRVYVADRHARHRRLVSRDYLAFEPRIRPDGRAVLWLTGVDGGSLDVCWTPLRRSLSARCAGRAAVEGSWAPRNRFLIREQDYPWTGIVRRIDDYDRPGIVLDAPEDARASAREFSPDGRRIAVVEHTHAGPARIAVYSARTWRRLRALTADHYDTHPVWSPDGRWIAFWRDPENPGDGLGTVGQTASIKRVRARGGPVRTVVKRGRDVGPPAWGR
jgi:Tol biopolymer transport system component